LAGGLKAGDTVLVLGTGGVSIYALQFAKAMGARVIATTSSEAKRSRLEGLGANEVINYRTHANWGKEVLRLTGSRGVDHVVEVGGPGTLGQSITAVRIGGSITMVGILTGFAGEVSTAALTMKQIRIKGVVVGSRSAQIDMVRAIEASGIHPVIDRSFSLNELAEGFRYQASGGHVGKICIRY
jgi:NADPH:quinone reductase-like Zn-dependent oxidoreductase